VVCEGYLVAIVATGCHGSLRFARDDQLSRSAGEAQRDRRTSRAAEPLGRTLFMHLGAATGDENQEAEAYADTLGIAWAHGRSSSVLPPQGGACELPMKDLTGDRSLRSISII